MSRQEESLSSPSCQPEDLTWSAADLAEIRSQAAQRLAQLHEKEEPLSARTVRPWVRGRGDEEEDGSLSPPSAATSKEGRFFNATGFWHARQFASDQECRAMKEQMARLVQEDWHPDGKEISSFGTGERHNTARGDYFLDSADRIHFFAEPEALHEEGEGEEEGQQRLKEPYQSRENKILALNKVGHALHCVEGAFRDYCLSEKVLELVTKLGWQYPVVPQSMYIFKQATHGGVVHSHQDSTFLYTTPRQTCLGLWLALDEARIDNGCLWVRPYSHREPVRRQFRRNPAVFSELREPPHDDDNKGATLDDDTKNDTLAATDSSTEPPKLIMENLYQHNMVWDGGLPAGGWRGLLEAGFVPVECCAGDLLAFCGELDHLSLPNHSDRPRHTFQLHLVEGGPGAGVEWSRSNWLQYPPHKSFVRLQCPDQSQTVEEDAVE